MEFAHMFIDSIYFGISELPNRVIDSSGERFASKTFGTAGN